MNILVFNCGSSSIKYQLLNLEATDHTLIAKGLVDRIGIDGSLIELEVEGREDYEKTISISNHVEGIKLILDALVDEKIGVIKSLDEINAAGHRVAHGGETFTESVIIDSSVRDEIKECIGLAPLHNPANIAGIDAISELLPKIEQVAVFDTAFHQSIPKPHCLYPIPYEYYENLRVRRYGFHGTSHKYVAKKACNILGMDFLKSKIITCHLGNGASIAAICNGKSIDTSMGFTPNEGLMMGTRCGSIDPGALIYIANKMDMSLDELNVMMNQESGIKGVSGISSDMRDVGSAAAEGHKRANLALDMYVHRVKRFIGAFAAVINGADILIFTGGIGENNTDIRSKCASNMEYLGVEFDEERNSVRGVDAILTTDSSKVKVMAITTNEELVIAQESFSLISK